MRCVLAIDSGGTKTEALVVREDGVVLGWGRCGYGNPQSGRSKSGSGRSQRSIGKAVAEALGELSCDELHVMTLSWTPPVFWHEDRLPRVLLHMTREYEPAFALTGETHGIVALAGTGAVVFARHPDGRHLHMDGLGPLFGDRGSGFHIGLLAVRAVGKSWSHPRHATSLKDRINDSLRGNNGDARHVSLVEFMLGDYDRAEIAAFAGIVNEEAEAGDPVATRILETAADELADTVYDAIDTLGMRDEPYPLIGTGSVAMRSRIYWQRFCVRVQEFAPNLRPLLPELPPVAGIALIMLQRLAAVDPDTLRATLFRTTREVMNLTPSSSTS